MVSRVKSFGNPVTYVFGRLHILWLCENFLSKIPFKKLSQVIRPFTRPWNQKLKPKNIRYYIFPFQARKPQFWGAGRGGPGVRQWHYCVSYPQYSAWGKTIAILYPILNTLQVWQRQLLLHEPVPTNSRVQGLRAVLACYRTSHARFAPFLQ